MPSFPAKKAFKPALVPGLSLIALETLAPADSAATESVSTCIKAGCRRSYRIVHERRLSYLSASFAIISSSILNPWASVGNAPDLTSSS